MNNSFFIKRVSAIMLTTGFMLTACGSAAHSAGDLSPADGTLDSSEVDVNRKTISIDTQDFFPINDTNGDGMGEFEGWGTSLCWWANRVGYNEALTADAAAKFYGADGLALNIGRYNVGGGDHVTDEMSEMIDPDDEFLHQSHITRSDSAVPGYACDVTKIKLSEHDLSWYEENFARADAECGYAWNYDWDVDRNQMNVLKAVAKATGDSFIAEAFSNSPPYFMTVSGCSSGNENAGFDNLRPDSYHAFAAYMADVIEHWDDEGVITFQSADPMNEPGTSYWEAYSPKQEGCHFDIGESQSKILTAFHEELKNKGIDIILCGTDETNIDTAYKGYNAFTDEARDALGRIDTHSYAGSNRVGVRKLALDSGKNLWMSEVDGNGVLGTGAGEMAPALWLGDTIEKDMKGLRCSAWILWDIIDTHVDSQSSFDSDHPSVDEMYASMKLKEGNGFWGVAIADHDKSEVILTMKYYGFGQYTRYIRPGMTILGSANGTLVCYDPEQDVTVIVAENTKAEDQNVSFDLSGFAAPGTEVTAIRTSGSMENGEKWADVTETSGTRLDADGKKLDTTLKAYSITTFVIRGSKL